MTREFLHQRPESSPEVSAAVVLEMQARWVAIAMVAGSAAWGVGAWARSPDWSLASVLMLGALAIRPRHLMWIPPSMAGAWLAGGLLSEVHTSPVLAAGATAGLVTGLLCRPVLAAPRRVHMVLACTAGSGLGLLAAHSAHADLVGTLEGVWTASVCSSFGASSGLWLLAAGQSRTLPTRRQIAAELLPPYRQPVVKALALYADALKWAGEADHRMGLKELVLWTWDLQTSVQAMDQQLARINIEDIHARRSRHEEAPSTDTVTRAREEAIGAHLDRLVEHHATLTLERQRALVHVDYALAFLEEARAGLAIARELPADALPEGLSEVLKHLRDHAQHAHARRRTARELQSVR